MCTSDFKMTVLLFWKAQLYLSKPAFSSYQSKAKQIEKHKPNQINVRFSEHTHIHIHIWKYAQ